MIERINELEKIARQLEPEQQTRIEWNHQTQEYADQFLNELNTLAAFIDDRNEKVNSDTFKIENTSEKLHTLLHQIKTQVDTIGINPASGGHFGYVPGGGLFPSALGDYLAAVTNRYAGLFFASPGAVRMENELIRWMCQLMGFPSTALGNLTSGGSTANLIAITTAREARDIKARDFEKQVFYLSTQTHHAAQKAIRIAGMNEAIIRYIPMNDRFRMDTEALSKQIHLDLQAGLSPFLLVASAGTTDTGAVDSLEKISTICARHDIWMHVDAAYGGFFILAESVKQTFKGIEKADSITIDPHKGLFLPYGSGAVLIKDTQALYNAHFYKANYLQDTDKIKEELPPADLSPELTKHFRGLRMWLPLKLFGLNPFKAALEEKVLLCRYFYEEVQKIGFEVGPFPDLSILIFRFIPLSGNDNSYNSKIVKTVLEDGRIFLSSTTIDAIYWIRFAVVCFRSHKEHVDLCLEILAKAVKERNGVMG